MGLKYKNEHIKKHHYLWNYIFYMILLKFKNHDSLVGIDKEVFEKIRANDPSWIPWQRSMQLEGEKNKGEKKVAVLKVLEQVKDV